MRCGCWNGHILHCYLFCAEPASSHLSFFFSILTIYIYAFCLIHLCHSSGAVWESRWPSWAVRPNEPSGFHGCKELLHRASALVTTCPKYVNWHLRTLSITSSSSSSYTCDCLSLISHLVSVDVKHHERRTHLWPLVYEVTTSYRQDCLGCEVT